MTTHVEDFAARLRELKERSGRSYGQLAARLHLSTSTLHRYCNGAAVPTEYAPVERLARLCGATREELVALHRLWLLADAARREPGRSAPAPESAPTPGSVPDAGSAPERAPGPERGPAPAAGPAAGSAPEAGSEPERTPEPARGTAPEPAPAAGPETQPGPGPEAAPEPTPAPGPTATPDPEPAPAPAPETGSADDEPAGWAAGPGAAETAPRRSRRTALVVAATAIAVVTALPVALHAWGGPARNTAAARPSATGATAGGPTAAGPASPASPATTGLGADPTRATPTRTSADTTGPDSTGSTNSPGSGNHVSGDNAPAPFHVNVLADNWDTQCGQWFLMRQQPGKVPPPPSLGQTGAWAAALGGIPADHLRLQLTAQTGATQPIVLHALYVHVISSRPAPKGLAYTPGSGCGGALVPASFAVDLDTTVPRTRPVKGYVGSGTDSVRSDFPYRISATDPQVLNVDASTAGQDVSWYLELSWSSGDRSGKAVVDDHGRPFRTVGVAGDPAYYYDGTAWAPTSVSD